MMDNMLLAEDRLAIMDVLVRYATGIDQRNWPLFRTCFTDDFTAEYDGFGTWTSGDEITQVMIGAHEQVGATMHRMSNMAIEPTATGAKSRTYVDAVLMPLEAGGPTSQATGYYDDTHVKTEAGWKIASRKFTFVRFRQAIDPPSPFAS